MPQFIPGFALVGTTATGKTQLALDLAKWWLTQPDSPGSNQVELVEGIMLISADSRQVYRGLEIVSGADIPSEFQPQTSTLTHQNPSVAQILQHYFWLPVGKKFLEIWGVAGLAPTQDWSVAEFQQFVQVLLKRAQTKKMAVILVGGSGLYHQLIWQKDWQISLIPNQEIRTKAQSLTIIELQVWLQKLAPQQWERLNQSDRANPRRLVRQLELATFNTSLISQATAPAQTNLNQVKVPTLGLTRSITELPELIQTRVKFRLKLGAEAEVMNLELAKIQPMVTSALGVKEIGLKLAEKISDSELIELWTKHELQYAKRQLTWWKKRTGVTWIEANHETQLTVLAQAKQWLTQTHPKLPLS